MADGAVPGRRASRRGGAGQAGGRSEIEANDWSLTPGRYVGVAPEEEDEGFDFEEALREIHIELEGLNAEAAELAARISKNFKELGMMKFDQNPALRLALGINVSMVSTRCKNMSTKSENFDT